MNQAQAADLPLIWGYFATASSMALLVWAVTSAAFVVRPRAWPTSLTLSSHDVPQAAPGKATVGAILESLS